MRKIYTKISHEKRCRKNNTNFGAEKMSRFCTLQMYLQMYFTKHSNKNENNYSKMTAKMVTKVK